MNRIKDIKNQHFESDTNQKSVDSDFENFSLDLDTDKLTDVELVDNLKDNEYKQNTKFIRRTKSNNNNIISGKNSKNNSKSIKKNKRNKNGYISDDLSDISLDLTESKMNDITNLDDFNKSRKSTKNNTLRTKSKKDSLFDLDLTTKKYDTDSFYIRPSPIKKASKKEKSKKKTSPEPAMLHSRKENTALQESLNRFKEQFISEKAASPVNQSISNLNNSKKYYSKELSLGHILLENKENNPISDKNITREIYNHNALNFSDVSSIQFSNNIQECTNIKVNNSNLKNNVQRKLFEDLFDIKKVKKIKKKHEMSHVSNRSSYDLFDREDDSTFLLEKTRCSSLPDSFVEEENDGSDKSCTINQTTFSKSRLLKSLDVTEDLLNELMINDNDKSIRRSKRRKVQTLPPDQYQIIEYVRTKLGYEIKDVIKLQSPKIKPKKINNTKTKRIYIESHDIDTNLLIKQKTEPIKVLDKNGNEHSIKIFLSKDSEYFEPDQSNPEFKMFKFFDNDKLSTGSIKIAPGVNKGLQLSMLYVVLTTISGVVTLEIDNKYRMIGPGCTINIPPGIAYDLINKTKEDVIVYYTMIK